MPIDVEHVSPRDSGVDCGCHVCTTPVQGQESGNDFVYELAPVLACEVCGNRATANYADDDNHYVCDEHAPTTPEAYTMVLSITKYQLAGWKPEALARIKAERQRQMTKEC